MLSIRVHDPRQGPLTPSLSSAAGLKISTSALPVRIRDENPGLLPEAASAALRRQERRAEAGAGDGGQQSHPDDHHQAIIRDENRPALDSTRSRV
ncbi:hypothetical protein [Methylobacterium sp. AMS5]|uniref:hypothetical protein n=1 Tax=Methylobacterium sp. AMS5 TaxID=925818 RepID=UPI001187676D|nr:hypothetical protein [Methylobacterium sp. AMS5]